MLADGFNDAFHSIRDRRERVVFEFEGTRSKAEILCSPNIRGKPGGADKCLRWDAPGVKTIASKSFLLNQRHAGAKLSRTSSNYKPGGTTTNDDDLVCRLLLEKKKKTTTTTTKIT